MTNRHNPHLGSTLDDLLQEDGSLADAHALAVKRVLAWRVGQTMSDLRISKSEMARRIAIPSRTTSGATGQRGT